MPSYTSSTKMAEVATAIIGVHGETRLDTKAMRNISRLLRPKNAGPYEITLDVMFHSTAEHRIIKDSNLLTARAMATLLDSHAMTLYGTSSSIRLKVGLQGDDPSAAEWETHSSGGFMENDVRASQQYLESMNLTLLEDLIQQWNKLQQ
jgi:hypothetical protein